jgi:hypothetical protein
VSKCEDFQKVQPVSQPRRVDRLDEFTRAHRTAGTDSGVVPIPKVFTAVSHRAGRDKIDLAIAVDINSAVDVQKGFLAIAFALTIWFRPPPDFPELGVLSNALATVGCGGIRGRLESRSFCGCPHLQLQFRMV